MNSRQPPRPGRVVQDRHDLHLQTSLVNGGLEEADDLLPLHPGTVEGLRPGDQSGRPQPLLQHREGESEAEAEFLPQQAEVGEESLNAAGQEAEEFQPRAQPSRTLTLSNIQSPFVLITLHDGG